MALATAPKRTPKPRLQREPRRAQDAFNAYCAMGSERSLRLLAERGRNAGADWNIAAVERWSTAYDWQERVAEYDRKVSERVARQQAKADADDLVRRRRERLQDADIVRVAARKGVMDPKTKQPRQLAVGARVKNGEMSPRAFEVVVTALGFAATSERTETGQPTSRTDITTQGEAVSFDLFGAIKRLRDEERARLEQERQTVTVIEG